MNAGTRIFLFAALALFAAEPALAAVTCAPLQRGTLSGGGVFTPGTGGRRYRLSHGLPRRSGRRGHGRRLRCRAGRGRRGRDRRDPGPEVRLRSRRHPHRFHPPEVSHHGRVLGGGHGRPRLPGHRAGRRFGVRWRQLRPGGTARRPVRGLLRRHPHDRRREGNRDHLDGYGHRQDRPRAQFRHHRHRGRGAGVFDVEVDGTRRVRAVGRRRRGSFERGRRHRHDPGRRSPGRPGPV